MLCAVTTMAKKEKNEPAAVIITAGQSNTDGRVMNSELPGYIKSNGFKHCYWCYGSAGQLRTDGFELFGKDGA